MLQTAAPELRGHSTPTATRLCAGNVSASGPLPSFLLCGTGSSHPRTAGLGLQGATPLHHGLTQRAQRGGGALLTLWDKGAPWVSSTGEARRHTDRLPPESRLSTLS